MAAQQQQQHQQLQQQQQQPQQQQQQQPPCKECTQDISEMELQAEIEHLKRHLAERDNHIEAMETEFLKGNTRIAELEQQTITWKEKYDRLYDSHRRVQRLNQNLEEKLLQMVDKCTDDKSQLTRDVETLSLRLAESNYAIGHLHKENERFKNDMNLAIQLLQCKPDNFVSQKFDSLPPETQSRVSTYIMSKAKLNQDPPQASQLPGKNNSLINEKINPDDFEFNISASLMSKILEESYQNTITNHCDTCTCLKRSGNPFSMCEKLYSVGTQTNLRADPVCPFCIHCNPEVTSSKAANTKCSSSPFSMKNSDKDTTSNVLSPPPVSLDKYLSTDGGRFLKPVEPAAITPKQKPNEEKLKVVETKNREMISKIGEELKEMNLKDSRYTNMIPSIEPTTGHHRLCDRTKSQVYSDELDFTAAKPINELPLSNKPTISVDQIDTTFGQIENSVLIPNISETRIDVLKETSDTKTVMRGGSISSNDAESKTSSNKSSNPKVQIGPGPRFCSLIVQPGSKNILLDNAQPNIAPILYTRQSRNLDNAIPLTYNLNLEMSTGIKQPSLHEFSSHSLNNKLIDRVDNILDLPNEDLLIRDPIDLCEKPESGYKSNESAEIIDKLLFGSDHMLQDSMKKEENLDLHNPIEFNLNNKTKDNLLHYDLFEEKVNKPKEEVLKDSQIQIDISHSNKKILNDMKIFNFDSYEKNLTCSTSPKVNDDIFDIPIFLNDDKLKKANPQFPEDNHQELLNSSFDLKIASKNLSEISKKYQLPVPVIHDNVVALETQKIREWKKETYTEKSSSSLSSDDSAAVLQKQQLMRVAEWVQKNLELEQQADFETSADSCRQSVEEMHHVRNDFPRPAKVDHRIRKARHVRTTERILDGNSNPYTVSNEMPPPDTRLSNITVEKLTLQDISAEAPKAIKMCSDVATSVTDSNTNSTTRSYSKQELARMEYNVKQFLLNGSRWTQAGPTKARRTSSKTETDL